MHKNTSIRFIAVFSLVFFLFTLLAPFAGITIANAADVTNVALGKPVTSSDDGREDFNHDMPPAEAVDGIGFVYDNGWDSKSSLDMEGAWLQIDLQGQYIIKRIEIDDRHGDSWEWPRKGFEIRASNDPDFETYVVLGGIANDGTPFEDDTTWCLDVENWNGYRYIRYVRTIQMYTFLSEIRVFGTPVPAVSNVALGKPVSSSDDGREDFNHDMPPAEAVDGIGFTYDNGWDSKSSLDMEGAWLQIDLLGEYVITRVEIDDRLGDSWEWPRKGFEIRASNDPDFETYDVLGGIANDGTPFEDDTTWSHDVADWKPYRYVRYVRTIQMYTFLSELRVMGFATATEPQEPQEPGETGETLVYYVSPYGSDENEGTEAEPFATIEKARDVIRSEKGSLSVSAVVYLRGGEYKFTEPVVFGPGDSAPDGNTITYRNYPGETPVFTGAEVINGWIEEDGVFKTNVGSKRFRDLYVNGQRALRARTESYKIRGWDDPAREIKVDAAAAAELDGIDLSRVDMVINQHWIESHVRLADYYVDGSQMAIVMEPVAREKIFTTIYPDRAVNQSIHFENSKKYMDKPGEWYLDEESGDLYYLPREGETLEGLNAVTPSVETFIKLVGTANNPVKNLCFSGIIFEYSRFSYPDINNGIIQYQAGWINSQTGYIRPPAAIYLEGADNNRFEGNIFRHIGATAIDIQSKAHNNTVNGNAFLDIGGSAIYEGLYHEPNAMTTVNPLLITQNNKFTNNYMNGLAVRYIGGGIICGYTQGVLIENNEMANSGAYGVHLGWGWTPRETALRNNIIRKNNIYGTMNRIADGAAIYTISNQPNSLIAENYIHDFDKNEWASNYFGGALYLDQETAGYTVRDNVLTRVGTGETLYLNMVRPDANIIINNESQNQSVKDNAGVQPQYWDIIPGVIEWNGSGDWTAVERGAVRIYGTVALKEAGNSVTASILKNGEEVWSGNVTSTDGVSYLKNIDVAPGDVISFEVEAGGAAAGHLVEWSSLIKPEIYVPRLVIESFTLEEQIEPAKINCKDKTVTIKVASGTDLKSLNPVITTPEDTVLEPLTAAGGDFSQTVTYRVWMKEDSKHLGFAGERKFKDWKVTVIALADETPVKGYNIGNIINDPDNWYVAGGSKTAASDKITFNNGYSIYRGRKFKDELLEFDMDTSASNWPSITLRNQKDNGDAISNTDTYLIVIKKDVIEAQRFNNGVRTVFYGNIGSDPNLLGDAIPNTYFEFGKRNHVQAGALNTDDGVRLVMYINGKKVFDFVDTWEGKITREGYFGTYQSGNSITLSTYPVVTKLNSIIADTDNWYVAPGGTKTPGTGSLDLSGTYAVYQGRKFENELLEFELEMPSSGWPSITLRNQKSDGDAISNTDTYLVVVKSDVIEVQRFNNGQRTVFYGNIGDSPSLKGDAIPNTFFEYGKKNSVKIGAVNTDAGVRLLMYINGKKVFDFVDTWEGKITGAGYFGTYQHSNTITLSEAPVETSLNDVIADTENWYVAGGSRTASEGSITFENGFSVYRGKKFQNELLEFNLKLPETGWPSIVLRNQKDDGDAINNTDAYLIVIKKDVIEAQRFHNQERTVFYGNIGNNPNLVGDAIPNTFFQFGKSNFVQVGAINTDEGVRLLMYIDGKKVFDFVDTWEGKITEAGYFGTYQSGNSMTLGNTFIAVTEDTVSSSLLELEISKAEALITGAEVGNEDGQYPAWAMEYLAAAIEAAQAYVDGESYTRQGLDEQLAALKLAESAFVKSQKVIPNIALNKPVTSSDGTNILPAYPPSAAVDGTYGVYNNGWSAESSLSMAGAWLQIDLQKEAGIKRIEIEDRPNDDWEGIRQYFEIRASNDPEFNEYVVLGEVGAIPFDNDTTWVQEVNDPNKYRYIRYVKTRQLYGFVAELRVFGIVEPETYSIGGTIRDGSGQAVAGAEVKLYSFDDTDTVLATAVSEPDGTYTLTPTQVSGKYIVTAQKAESGEGSAIVYVPYTDVANADVILTGGEEENHTPVPGPTPAPTPAPAPDDSGSKLLSPPVLQNGTAQVTVDRDALSDLLTASSRAVIEIPWIKDAAAYEVSLPASALSSGNAEQRLEIVTEIGTIVAPAQMLSAEDVKDTQKVVISIAAVDKESLAADLLELIGNRPVVEINILIDGRVIAWNNPEAPVAVSIPYTPTDDELADPEHIVVWYIDGSGKAAAVPTGKYDAATGMVTFTTTHLSMYAIAFVRKTFNDISNYAWAKKEIEVLASKGVINGTSELTFTPGAAIKRADFILLLVKALGLTAKVDSNFSDVSASAYYAEAVGIAKKLGIAAGVGGNKFNPEAAISRQDMMTLISRAMAAAGKELEPGTDADLDKFADKASVADYASQSVASLIRSGIVKGDGTRINPLGEATRAETAVMIYRIYNK